MENTSTLQEYCVYDGENDEGPHVGRADLLVRWEDMKSTSHFLLIEAKWHGKVTLRYIHEDNKNFYDGIAHQAKKYYAAESDYYKDRKTCIVALAFQELHGKAALDKAKEYQDSSDKTQKPTDFCCLYGMNGVDNSGIWVCGRIYTPAEVLALEP
jgi:hypothetical protein